MRSSPSASRRLGGRPRHGVNRDDDRGEHDVGGDHDDGDPTETATTSTETGPVSATITVTTTVNPTGAAVVGAAAASSKDESETDWGWVAFGILAAVVLIGGIVWLVVRRRRPRTA